MIDLIVFRGFAYPWRLYAEKGLLLASGRGTVFHEPKYDLQAETEAFLGNIRDSGWYECPSRKMVFACRQPSNDRLFIFPGLTISRLIRLKSHGDHAPPTTPSQPEFEQLVKEALAINDQAREHLNVETVAFTHDYRRINAALYHQALALQRDLGISGEIGSKFIGRSQDLINLIQLHRVTTDWAQYRTDPSPMMQQTLLLNIGTRVVNIANSWRLIAEKKDVEIAIENTSQAALFGAAVFDVVPYSLIDNAVKYSPRRETISVKVEDASHVTTFKVGSIGPMIEPSELKSIFEIGVRGRFALTSGIVGSGMGLSLVADIVFGLFKGTVRAKAKERFVNRGVPHGQIEFTVTIPH